MRLPASSQAPRPRGHAARPIIAQGCMDMEGGGGGGYGDIFRASFWPYAHMCARTHAYADRPAGHGRPAILELVKHNCRDCVQTLADWEEAGRGPVQRRTGAAPGRSLTRSG